MVPAHTVVAFIGLGRMGKPMAHHVLAAGFPLVVHNRSRSAVDALVADGARAAASPAAAAEAADVVITMLPDGPDVDQVLTGPHGVLSSVRPGTLLVDMSSIAPATAIALAERADASGVTMLDAPVSGGDIGAIQGTLSIMVGGRREDFDRARPLFETMGNPDRITYLGPSGSGQTCKICNQLVIGASIAAVGEAFALARKSGLDPAQVRAALLGGFAASRVLEVHGERLLTGNFTPGFRADLYAKDMRIAAATLATAGVPAVVAAMVQQLVTATVAAGKGAADYSAVGTVAATLAGLPD